MGEDLLGELVEHLVEEEVRLRLDLDVEVLLLVAVERGEAGVGVGVEGREERRHEVRVADREDVLRQDGGHAHRERELDAPRQLEVELRIQRQPTSPSSASVDERQRYGKAADLVTKSRISCTTSFDRSRSFIIEPLVHVERSS